MRDALSSGGGDVLESSNPSHLELSLRLQALLLPETVLLVLGVRLAAVSAFTIRALAHERTQRLLRPAHVVLTYEFGTLPTIAIPDLAPCRMAAILEKPFDLQSLQGIASACLHESAGDSFWHIGLERHTEERTT
jgi:hypothetical protein